jgi:succinylglutamic semialdehyde dehydrogenase
MMHHLWEKSGLPKDVLQLVQGGSEQGKILSSHLGLDGLMFTGSYPVGQILAKQFSNFPEKILALEMGGNNPLLVDFSDETLLDAAVYLTIQSAYITTGQRCTCARRLILIENKINKLFLEKLIIAIQKIKIGAYTDSPEPFIGPLISIEAAKHVLDRYNALCAKGATIYVPMTKRNRGDAFLSPGLIDVTSVSNIEDEEIFGPLLQVTWVKDFAAGIQVANNTNYGLAAGLFSEDKNKYEQFLNSIQAGLINWNRPLTGASSRMPFGGVQHSGNHRPSAWYAADYCAYPVASMEEETLTLPNTMMPGITQ